MSKIYIAGKIEGDPNYLEKFNAVEAELTAQGHIVMNPAILPEGFEFSEYMEIFFRMIDPCDTIYLLPDWEDSIGARMEFHYAKDRFKRIMKAPKNQEQTCRACGCTWDCGCPGGCYWVEDDLCSCCAEL